MSGSKNKRLVLPSVFSFGHFGGICLLLVITLGTSGCLRRDNHLPPPERAIQEFQRHKSDFIRFATLLRKEYLGTTNRECHVVEFDAVPEYRELAQRIGLKSVLVREDGAVEFELWGQGGAIRSDSYLGVRYYPRDHDAAIRAGWTQTVVGSLDADKLPQEHGTVATGLYVIPVEPEWFIYRFEYQE
jgi:hypothetical protein